MNESKETLGIGIDILERDPEMSELASLVLFLRVLVEEENIVIRREYIRTHT
jgi:hypothetical protein